MSPTSLTSPGPTSADATAAGSDERMAALAYRIVLYLYQGSTFLSDTKCRADNVVSLVAFRLEEVLPE